MNESKLLGVVGWDGANATSERVLLRASLTNRAFVERNHYVRIEDHEGERTGFLARVVAGPFFHRSGAPTVGGTTAGTSLEGSLLVTLEIQGELVKGRSRDTNSRPVPGARVFSLTTEELANLYGFRGDVLLGSVAGQDALTVHLQSDNKGVLPRNLGIFGTVGSGKSNTTQVVIEEASRNGWAVIVLDVEGEYVDMDLPSEEHELHPCLSTYGRSPEGIPDFQVLYPASCDSEKAGAEPFTLRLANFDANVICEILNVAMPERNALLDCMDHLQTKARKQMTTKDSQGYETLLDASPDAKVPFTLNSLRERAIERSPRTSEQMDYAGINAKLKLLFRAESFDLPQMSSLDVRRMMHPCRVSIVDVSIANDVIKNLVTVDLLSKAFALKMTDSSTPPTLLILEEAHSFISRDREQSMQATLQMLQNVIRRGRKRWLAMAFVTQQPGHLPSEIFELCNTRIVHALRSTHNLDVLMATTGGVSGDTWARCSLLGPGQAVLSSPQLARPVVLSVRPASSQRRFTR